MGTGLVLGLLAAGGLGLLFFGHEDRAQVREIWLEPGKQYYIQIVWGAGTYTQADLDTYAAQLASFGFTDIQWMTTTPGAMTFRASWTHDKTLWQLPDNVAVAEVA